MVVRVNVGVRISFRFMGGVGGWFGGNVPPTPPSGLVRVKVGVRFISRFIGGVGGWFLGNVPPISPLG